MKKEKSFIIDLEREFIIYGASFLGRKLYKNLTNQGYKVIAFLDKDADKFNEVSGIAVLKPDNKMIHNIQKDLIIVIVAITNYKEHSYVAKYLNKLGYKNIIFRTNAIESKYFTDMNIVYDFLEADKEIKGISTLKYEYQGKEKDIPFDLDYCKAIDNNTYQVFIPTELLFYKKKNELISAYQVIPLLPFYNFIEGKESEEFLNSYFTDNLNERDWERWMDEERNYYKHFSFNNDFNKINESLPKVYWDEKGYFVVQRLLRYVIYNIAKGNSKVLCVVSKDDYEKWINRDMIDACFEAINEGNLSFVYTPIPHPAFFDFPCKRDECGKTRLITICEYLYKNNIDIKDKRILDAGSYVCYFSQHMHRMGANITAVEFDTTSYDLAEKLNKLLFCNGINHINCGVQEIDKSIKYDITFLLTVLYWHLHTELAFEIIKTIDSVTKGILFWESGNEIEFEKQWILKNSTFNYYEKICNTFGTGKLRELGVFSRK